MGAEGAAGLAEALRTPGALPQLQWLLLGDNGVGDEGAAPLAGALRTPGAAPQLQRLDLMSNELGEGGRAALEAAWRGAARPEEGTFQAVNGTDWDRGLIL